ncbi:hypothetical protein CsSME_00044616 [Camellia sinensis var. sinensis]
MEEEDDPFASLIKTCKPTSSQEDVLRTCPFARESELFSDQSPSSESSGIPVEPTGIIMVSPPESSRGEDFQTRLQDSLHVSSEEQRPPTAAVDVGETVDAEGAVDLGNDSDNLGFSGVKSTQVIGSSRGGVDGGGVAANCDVFEREFEELEKLMLLARESRFASDHKARDRHKNGSIEVLHSRVEEIGEELSADKVTDELPLRETQFREALNKGDEAVAGVGGHRHGNGSTEVVDSEVEGIGEVLLGADKVTDELPLRETEVGEDLLNKGDEVVVGVGGRRELPPSITGQGKNAGEMAGPGNLAAKNQIFKDILDALKRVAGEVGGGGTEEEDVDFLETAKRRRVSFPRPRWWPPEGYED